MQSDWCEQNLQKPSGVWIHFSGPVRLDSLLYAQLLMHDDLDIQWLRPEKRSEKYVQVVVTATYIMTDWLTVFSFDSPTISLPLFDYFFFQYYKLAACLWTSTVKAASSWSISPPPSLFHKIVLGTQPTISVFTNVDDMHSSAVKTLKSNLRLWLRCLQWACFPCHQGRDFVDTTHKWGRLCDVFPNDQIRGLWKQCQAMFLLDIYTYIKFLSSWLSRGTALWDTCWQMACVCLCCLVLTVQTAVGLMVAVEMWEQRSTGQAERITQDYWKATQL